MSGLVIPPSAEIMESRLLFRKVEFWLSDSCSARSPDPFLWALVMMKDHVVPGFCF